jgi:hypothetical protein
MGVLNSCGFLTTVLDANASIPINPVWRDVNDFFSSVHRGREMRREWRRFNESEYRIEWSDGIAKFDD